MGGDGILIEAFAGNLSGYSISSYGIYAALKIKMLYLISNGLFDKLGIGAFIGGLTTHRINNVRSDAFKPDKLRLVNGGSVERLAVILIVDIGHTFTPFRGYSAVASVTFSVSSIVSASLLALGAFFLLVVDLVSAALMEASRVP